MFDAGFVCLVERGFSVWLSVVSVFGHALVCLFGHALVESLVLRWFSVWSSVG